MLWAWGLNRQGKVDENTTFDSSDFRAKVPRFAPDALKANLALVDLTVVDLQEIDATMSQFTLQGARLPESVLSMTGL